MWHGGMRHRSARANAICGSRQARRYRQEASRSMVTFTLRKLSYPRSGFAAQSRRDYLLERSRHQSAVAVRPTVRRQGRPRENARHRHSNNRGETRNVNPEKSERNKKLVALCSARQRGEPQLSRAYIAFMFGISQGRISQILGRYGAMRRKKSERTWRTLCRQAESLTGI